MRPYLGWSGLLLLALTLPVWVGAADEFDAETGADEFRFGDSPSTRHFEHPAWFKSSFLDLPKDLADARQAGKIGLIVYFGQQNCAYCEQLLQVNFGSQTDIAAYTRRYFEVVAVDIWGTLEVTTPDGRQMTEKRFADLMRTQFTPTLLFYNTDGQEIFRLRGYYPPYQFRAALDYVVGEYYKNEPFRAYLERADPPLVFDENDLNHSDLFSQPPYLLTRRQDAPAHRPLVVFFEQGKCHACDVLHGDLLYNLELYRDFEQMEVVQLDLWGDTPVLTPAGETLTARAWADKLGLFYTPTLIFFDTQGREIIRVDSVVQQYRLSKVLKYVLSGEYRQFPHFQRWYTERVLNSVE